MRAVLAGSLMLASSILLACASTTEEGYRDTQTDVPSDLTEEAAMDVPIDSGHDTAIDVPVDSGTDFDADPVPDTALDTAVDTGTDTGPDTPADTSADTRPDTTYDTVYDTYYDTRPDTPYDTPYDTWYDTGYDTYYDTWYDTGYDTGYDTYYDTRPDPPYDTVYDTPYDTAYDSIFDTSLDTGYDVIYDAETDGVAPCIAVNDGSSYDTSISMGGPAVGLKFTSPPSGATVSRCEVFTGEGTGGNTLGIWSHDSIANEPETDLGTGTWTLVSTNQWQGPVFPSPVTLTGSTTYWLVWDSNGGEQASRQSTGTTVEYKGYSGTWTGPYFAVWKFRCYCM